ncbi:hypothetical protein E2C01_063428 [Portunus trituberculatus]|uniref:Uncharacterized protein n=1 Tax=Portunus trituberculatus TaxID=210409 RepID=A0A5B7HDN3_PORTR|nr:hypothetical protein [Portunus trituberculatus]
MMTGYVLLEERRKKWKRWKTLLTLMTPWRDLPVAPCASLLPAILLKSNAHKSII